MIVIALLVRLLARRPDAAMEAHRLAIEQTLRAEQREGRGELRQQLDSLSLQQQQRIDGFGARLEQLRETLNEDARKARSEHAPGVARLRLDAGPAHRRTHPQQRDPPGRDARNPRGATARPAGRQRRAPGADARDGRRETARNAGDAPDRKLRPRHHDARPGAPGTGRHAQARRRCRRAATRADQREVARRVRRSPARGPARTGVRARPVRRERRHRAGQQRSRGIRGASSPAPMAMRRCGCRSTRSFRARTTSACSMRRSAPTSTPHAPPATRWNAACARKRARICEKYVRAPHTTEFAILFLPTEGLYAEVLRRPGLVESLQRDCRIAIAGPTTLLALMTSFQMGFRTLAIEKRSSEVWRTLAAVKTEFGKFGEVLDSVQKKLLRGQQQDRADRGTHACDPAPAARGRIAAGSRQPGAAGRGVRGRRRGLSCDRSRRYGARRHAASSAAVRRHAAASRRPARWGRPSSSRR